jgi:ABC-2 type transport system permease protein
MVRRARQGLREVRRGIRLYRRCLGAHLRASLEYEADFWLMIFAAFLAQVVPLVFIGAVFARIPDLNGWTMAEVVLITSLVVLAEGIGSLLYEGAWGLPWRVNQGEMDYLLVRPYSVLLQITSGKIGLNGVGNLLTGGLMFGWALANADVDLSPSGILLLIVMVISGVFVKFSIVMAATSVSFWLIGPNFNLAIALHQVGDLARYPLTVYGGAVRLGLTVLLPFGFVSFYPAAAVLRPETYRWATVVTPLVAGLCVLLMRRIVRAGLRRYESAGA